MTNAARSYLRRRFDLADSSADCIQIDGDSVNCHGRMPNSTETGWFFAGYLADVEREAAQEAAHESASE